MPFYSYDLHIGSAVLDHPGSLVFGGYNKARVIGPIALFDNSTAVELLDIGIRIEFGDSPFEFSSE